MANPPNPIPKLRLVDLAYLLLLAIFVAASFTMELGVMGALAGVLLVIAGIVLGIRHLRIFGKHLLWPLRNRLRVTYVFIGVVPILLIVILTALGVYIVTGEISSFLLNSELHRREGMLSGPAELVATTPASERGDLIGRIFPYFEEQFPGLQLCVRSQEGTWTWPPGNVCEFPPAGWNRTNGLVSRENRLYVWAYTRPNDAELSVMMPVTRAYLNELVPGLLDAEIVGRVEPTPQTGGGSPSASQRFYRFGPNRPGRRQPRDPMGAIPKANPLDFSVNWQSTLNIAEWTEPDASHAALLTFNTRPSAVWGVLSRREPLPGSAIDFTQYFAVMLFVSASILFLIVEACSLMAGMGLSRSITQAVENLYEGTQHVMRGQFQHRILVKGEDQLADLNRSFNRMTENLETLVAISKEKERMQSELEIAREVQVGLYPKEPPKFENIELVAMSQPARMASGDYFDYLRLRDDRIAIAIGDVAGKGISAALLMASIQSTMRAQLRPYLPATRGAADEEAVSVEALSTALLVSRLNQQIHQFTSASKFATFFFGVYDDRSGGLRYTNAGHLPPILLRQGKISRLNVDGLVVGAFSFATYEESALHLESGDVLVLYTDGITEPENEYGEEFGEERLQALLLAHGEKDARELADILVEAVRDWVGDAEPFDDITLLIVKKF